MSRLMKQVHPDNDAFNDASSWSSKTDGSHVATNDIRGHVTERQWPLLIKCLLLDDAASLRGFSTRVTNWRQFLLSWDTSRELRQCSAEYRRTWFGTDSAYQAHPYPTNVFLVAVMLNARLCCDFIRQSAPDLDLADVAENDFNAYHVLFLGLHAMADTDEAMEQKQQMEYMKYFLTDFFTSDQVARMSQRVNCIGMRPLDWGVYRGQIYAVEKLMYLSHTLDSKAQVAGVMEHVQLDLSFSVSTKPERCLTTMSIMADLYGETNLANLKHIGIFRRPLLIAPWIDALFRHNIWLLAAYIIERLSICCLSLIYFSYDVGDYLVDACTNGAANTAKPLPTGFLVTCGYSLLATAWQLGVSMVCVRLKHTHRAAKRYPSVPRRGIKDAVRWQLPYAMSAIFAIAMVSIVAAPQAACQYLGPEKLRSLIGCMMLVYVMSSILSALVLSRLIVVMSKFINSFYKSFSMFANFLLCYILLLVIFARLFQASGRFTWPGDSSGNCTDALAAPQRRLNFLESFYQSFLLTLNIVDTGTFVPLSDRVDLLVTHFAFILLVPILFINFVTGVLSSVVSDTMENDIEALYLMKLNFSEYAQTTYFWLYRIVERLLGRKARLVIHLCIPLHLGSKSIGALNETL